MPTEELKSKKQKKAEKNRKKAEKYLKKNKKSSFSGGSLNISKEVDSILNKYKQEEVKKETAVEEKKFSWGGLDDESEETTPKIDLTKGVSDEDVNIEFGEDINVSDENINVSDENVIDEDDNNEYEDDSEAEEELENKKSKTKEPQKKLTIADLRKGILPSSSEPSKTKKHKKVTFGKKSIKIIEQEESEDVQIDKYMEEVLSQLSELGEEGDIPAGIPLNSTDYNNARDMSLSTKYMEIIALGSKDMPVKIVEPKSIETFSVGDFIKGIRVLKKLRNVIFVGMINKKRISAVNIRSGSQFEITNFSNIQNTQTAHKHNITVFGTDDKILDIKLVDDSSLKTKIFFVRHQNKIYTAYEPYVEDNIVIYPGAIISVTESEEVVVSGKVVGQTEDTIRIVTEDNVECDVNKVDAKKIQSKILDEKIIETNVIKVRDLLDGPTNDKINKIACEIFMTSYNNLVPDSMKEYKDPGLLLSMENFINSEFNNWCGCMILSEAHQSLKSERVQQRIDILQRELLENYTPENIIKEFIKAVGTSAFVNAEELYKSIQNTYSGDILVISSLIKIRLGKIPQNERLVLTGNSLFTMLDEEVEIYLERLTRTIFAEGDPYNKKALEDITLIKGFLQNVKTYTEASKRLSIYDSDLTKYLTEKFIREGSTPFSKKQLTRMIYEFHSRNKFFRKKAEHIIFNEEVMTIQKIISVTEEQKKSFENQYMPALTKIYDKYKSDYDIQKSYYERYKTNKNKTKEQLNSFLVDCIAEGKDVKTFLHKFFTPVLYMRNVGAGAYAKFFKANVLEGNINIGNLASLPKANYFPELYMNKELYLSEKMGQLQIQLEKEIQSIVFECLSRYVSSYMLGKFEYTEVIIPFNWKGYLVVPRSVCKEDTNTGDKLAYENMAICYDPKLNKFTCHNRQDVIRDIKEGKNNPYTGRPYPEITIEKIKKLII